MRRLGVLSRSIIVLSVLWMAGGTLYFAVELEKSAQQQADAFLKSCNEFSSVDSECLRLRQNVYEAHTKELQGGVFGNAAVQAAILLALTLIALGIVYGSFRWIMAGRRSGIGSRSV